MTRLLSKLLILLALSPLHTQAGDWMGVWRGEGTASLFGSAPMRCTAVEYSVSRRDLDSGAFLLERSGKPHICGNSRVIPKTTLVIVRDNKLLLPIANTEQEIGVYSEDLIEARVSCPTCHPPSTTWERATKLGPDSYQLEQKVESEGKILMEYSYQLQREVSK